MLTFFLVLIPILLGLVEWFLIFSLSPLSTLFGLAVYRGSLPPRFVASLRRGQLQGFQVEPQTAHVYLLRPVYWTERGLSASPFSIGGVAKAVIEDSDIQVRGYAPLSGALFGAVAPFVAFGPPSSVVGAGVRAAIAVVLGWMALRLWRSEFTLWFDRLAKFGSSGSENDAVEQNAADRPA